MHLFFMIAAYVIIHAEYHHIFDKQKAQSSCNKGLQYLVHECPFCMFLEMPFAFVVFVVLENFYFYFFIANY